MVIKVFFFFMLAKAEHIQLTELKCSAEQQPPTGWSPEFITDLFKSLQVQIK